MEKQTNELENIISNAYRHTDPKKLNEILKLIYNRVNLRQCQLSRSDIEKLNKVGLKAEDIESSFLVGLVYNLIFSYKLIQPESFDPDGLLTIVNVLLPIYDRMPGTILNRRLALHIKNLLISLIKRPELRGEDKSQIFELLATPSIKQDNIYTSFDNIPQIKDIKESLKSQLLYDKVNGAMNLINAFSLCSDIEEQLDVFTKKLPDILKKGLTGVSEKDIDFLELVAHIADCMLFQTEFLVKIHKKVLTPSENIEETDPLVLNLETEPPSPEEKEEKSEDDLDQYEILPYRLVEQEHILKLCDNIYPAISFIVEALLKFPKEIEIQKTCVCLLERLFYMVPKFRKNIEEHIISAFSNINEDSGNGNKKEASTFLYKLIHRDADPDFKQHLINRESFYTLYRTPYYDESVLNTRENYIEALSLNELDVKAGFPNTRSIPAGSSHTAYIEVWKPMSILCWSFVLLEYDIGFTLTRVSSFDGLLQEKESQPVVLYQQEKIEASKHHCKGTFIVKKPGIFRLDFDNTHSWFNSKDLKYVAFVLDPDFRIEESGHDNPMHRNLEQEEGKSQNSGAHETQNPSQPRVLSAYGEPIDIETQAIISITPLAIEFSIKNKDKSHDIMINYRPEDIDWNQVNERIFETFKKLVEVGRTSLEHKVFLRIIYDEKAIKGLFGDNAKNPHKRAQEILSAFTCIEKLQNNIFEQVEVKSQIDYVMEKLLDSKHISPNDNVYAICANHFSQSFQSKYRCKNKDHKSFNFNNLCMPDTSGSDGDGWQLRTISELYFESDQSSKQITYLASLLINVFNFYGGEVNQFIVFEDKETSVLAEDNQNVIREIFKSYLSKKEGEGKSGAQEEKGQQSKPESPLNKGRKIPEIVFLNVKIQDYLKL